MAKKKQIHYNMDEIASLDCQWNMIIGERANGKSYQVKHKRGIEKYLKTGKRFVYLRRFKEEIKSSTIEAYFQDVDISKLTKGKYNTIQYWRNRIYLANYDSETNATKKGECIGYTMSLNQEQNYAGGSYLDVEDIIYEEFMSRSLYLAHEPDKLSNLYSTIDRKRGITKVWMVGNVISRACPYLVEWGILPEVARMKQGEILSKRIKIDDDHSISLAVEYTGHIDGSTSFVMGKHSAMINNGMWQSDPQPKLPKSKNDYDIKFRCRFLYHTFQYIGEVLKDPETHNLIWFIYPKTRIYENKKELLTFSDVISTSRLYNSDPYHCKLTNKRILNYLDLFTEDNIFYSDDLTGTEFKNVINFSIAR